MATTPRYGWKDKRIGGDPNVVAGSLLELERRFGRLTPTVVLDEARVPDSPLHRYFQWDDSVAAEAYRLEQARGLLRAVVMASPVQDGSTIRAFLLVDADDDGNYVNTVRAMSDDAMRAQVLRRAQAELRAFRAKYGHLKELAQVLTAIKEVA